MNYWHMQVHPNEPDRNERKKYTEAALNRKIIGLDIKSSLGPNGQNNKPLDEWDDSDFEGCIANHIKAGIGQGGVARVLKQFRDEIQDKDIVLVRYGATPVALVKIEDDCFFSDDDLDDYIWFRHRYKAKILGYYDEWVQKHPEIEFTPAAMGTLQPLINENSATYQGIEKWKKLIEKGEELNNFKSLLQINNQLIFTGAPGTGKTYKAKQIAKKMINENSHNADEKIQMGFVQFHPSYDYTDFIEGFRPTKVTDGNISFELKNGVFKEFCRKAGVIERIMFNIAFNSTKDGGIDWSKYNKDDIDSKLDEFCKGFSSNAVADTNDVKTFWQKWIKENEDIPKDDEIKSNLPKFVFIIDEINRAELSKVFGELMYSLEPEYRGVEGKIKTQYSNMATENTENTWFVAQKDDWFFIPSNVYIIGTMNDIDRSVEVFDFALRRRFSWHEIEVDEKNLRTVLQGMLKDTSWKNSIDGIIKKAEALNKVIEDSQWGLHKGFKIGPAYFGKIKLYNDTNENNALKTLWNNHLKPLIEEYVRGRSSDKEIKKFLEECKTSLNFNKRN
ncbi:AAA family ATPase [Desulfococcaceae bacterium HSG9]|nr:AAA family ATPase [Desulfococcaceae bacterium HSG9]